MSGGLAIGRQWLISDKFSIDVQAYIQMILKTFIAFIAFCSLTDLRSASDVL